MLKGTTYDPNVHETQASLAYLESLKNFECISTSSNPENLCIKVDSLNIHKYAVISTTNRE